MSPLVFVSVMLMYLLRSGMKEKICWMQSNTVAYRLPSCILSHVLVLLSIPEVAFFLFF